MDNDTQTAIRLPKVVLKQADKLVKELAPLYPAFRLTRSAVLRLAVAYGISELENQSRNRRLELDRNRNTNKVRP